MMDLVKLIFILSAAVGALGQVDGDRWPCNLAATNVTCNSDTFENAYHGDPEDCQRFYQCGAGGLTVHRLKCAGNSYWNRTGRFCYIPPGLLDTTFCEPPCEAGVTQYPISICSTAESPCTPGWRYPDQLWCEGYHRCNDDQTMTVRACRIDGWKFNTNTQKCEQTVDDEICENRCANANPPTTTGAPNTTAAAAAATSAP